MRVPRHLIGVAAAVAVAVGSGLGIAACGTSGRHDSPVGPQQNAPREVINMPDGYGNVAMACDGYGHRVYVVTHDNSDVAPVVVTDASCPGLVTAGAK